MGGEPELDTELVPLPAGLALKPNPEAMLEAKRETVLEPEPATEPAEPEEPDPLTKNGVNEGSFNTACAALLDF